jgi:hypothetical protein
MTFDAPMPRFDLLDGQIQSHPVKPYGCPLVDFCASSILLTSNTTQTGSQGHREIESKVWPRPFIEFADDNSFVLRALQAAPARDWKRKNFNSSGADLNVARMTKLLERCALRLLPDSIIGLESPRAEIASAGGVQI